ncbi:YdeI/OmpD-associated family protein [Hyphococcus flavus]|uniref:YdeI/OmpD-associated family protein n=1 Tax=Hyphococcus flavus TaxID=1866326 RepID=A0AAF0CHL0_9PROT|nr:DUF1801 domain-containing protein [Hyphococcus flavus]WDI32037.1 YdeI/OmpD-associated family protein [Hyphococcus flavus]
MKKAKSPDDYFKKLDQWGPELRKLREIINATELVEEIKWGMPCYTFNGKNVVGVCGFKSHFGLWFYQGALLKDEKKILINAQEGKTKAMRQWRMTSAADIKPQIIKRYLKESIALARDGKEIKPARKKPLAMPPELENALSKNKRAATAFEKLTPGLKREYADYIAEAKRADTKERRIKKIMPMIAKGAGLNDKYR